MTGLRKNLSDKRIAKFISEHSGEVYDDLIRDQDAAFFYYLSSLRKSLLSWFPFASTESVLEINGCFGALTGFLSEKFEHVEVLEPDPLRAESLRLRYPGKDNIHIVEQTIDRFSSDKKYDAVIYAALSSAEKGHEDELLEKLSSLISDDGVVLLGFANRYGAKYQCGGLDQHVSAPFDTADLFSKNELKETLENHFAYVKWYYPMPDERFVQAIYTDRSDFCTLSDRVFFFDGYNSPYIDDEKGKLSEYARCKTITDRVDYYLTELRKKASVNPVNEIYLSADREVGRKFQVTIREETVEKAPFDNQSIHALEDAHRNNLHLKNRGIPVVDETWCNGKIVMPRIKNETLLTHLGRVKTGNEVIDLFDLMYNNILVSSEHDNKNVLETGYIDMIPFNIFWDDGELLYYDQEFTLRNCDAAYIIFRALHYSWIHVPKLEEFVPLEELKQRYSITEEKWCEYLQTETEFVSRNRNYQKYAQVYRWSYLSKTAVLANRTRLLGFNPEQYSEIHEVELDILKYFKKFCANHDLSWFALHGTLLGAVRHGGFIPWDNDIDIGMRREDFDRLIDLFDNNSTRPYFLQTMTNDHWVFHGGYAKLCREDTTQIEVRDQYRPGHFGIGIDIFPLDYCEEDPAKFRRTQKLITYLQRLVFAKLYPLNTGMISDADSRLVSFYYLFGYFIPFRVLFFLLDKVFRKKKHSAKRAILACYYKYGINQNIYEDRDTADLSTLPFEDIEIKIIGNAEEYLAKRYGRDYMNIPANYKTKNNDTIFDVRKPYTEYRGW